MIQKKLKIIKENSVMSEETFAKFIDETEAVIRGD